MKIELFPIIRNLREIYDLNSVMDRYNSYVHLMTKARGEILPLGDFSPMGNRQREYLDALIEMGAEQMAQKACCKVADEVVLFNDHRMILVVVDEPRNGWTQRFLTEAAWRFTTLNQPKGCKTPWIVTQLWTTDDNLNYTNPTPTYIEQQIRSAIFRTFYQSANGVSKSLQDMLTQEAAVMKFSGETIPVNRDDLNQIADIIEQHLDSDNYAINFAAMYGDSAAKTVGYEPLGLPHRAGFAFAQSRI